jgi:hypothetical protein
MSNNPVKVAQDVPNLPKLLAALAAGARSVNALPKAPPPKDNDNDSESDDFDEFYNDKSFLNTGMNTGMNNVGGK